jgi:hypothetical protein
MKPLVCGMAPRMLYMNASRRMRCLFQFNRTSIAGDVSLCLPKLLQRNSVRVKTVHSRNYLSRRACESSRSIADELTIQPGLTP